MLTSKLNNSPTLSIESTNKGSNPGGLCKYSDGRKDLSCYFKYCVGSQIPKTSSLIPEHQPVYEAITFELARKLGLHTPNFFVLLNNKKNIKLEDPHHFSAKNHSGRNYYFLSELVYEPTNIPDLTQIGDGIIKNEKVYLDSLKIADVHGKRQNYMVLKPNGDFNVTYIDLGCSFVYATNGFIRLPNNLKGCSEKGIQKKERAALKNKGVIAADSESLVSLEELVHNFRELTIPTLNPSSNIPLFDLISEEEIQEIDCYVAHGLCHGLPEYKEMGLLI
jgi:hypothetical protein